MNWLSWLGVSTPATPEPEPLIHPRLDEAGYWLPGTEPRLVIFSGAGLSAESGLSTFRDTNGLWENHSIEEVCNGLTWRDNREKVERFYEQRRLSNQAAKPHDGHRFCAEMEEAGAVLITQNVDTLLERAGARHLIHLHGNIEQRQCFSCGGEWPAALSKDRCPFCQSKDTRVNVVFFKEPVPQYNLGSRIIGGLREQDTLLIVGTQASVLNPTRWLTQRCNVAVVDPNPSPRLLAWPKVKTFPMPASELKKAWHQLAHAF